MADTDRGHVAEASVTTETAGMVIGASGRTTELEGDLGTGARAGGLCRTLPLNSRRLTAGLRQQLAGGLGAQGDLLTLIEGKLAEAGRDHLHT